MVTTAATAETDLTTADSPAEAEPSPGVRGVPDIVRRRLSTLDERFNPYSWLVTAIIVAVAAILRFAGLSRPKGYIFDEVYYPTDAWDMLQHGVEWDEKNNGPAYVVHPPLGKWLIAFGEHFYGNTELGWRISAAVAGTLMILILIRVAYRLFHSIVLAATAGLLMTLDGFQLVLSRTSLLDIFLGLFILMAFAAMVLDRDHYRRSWQRALDRGFDPSATARLPRIVPWWLLAAGVSFGLAVSTKWTALYPLAAFGLLVWLWSAGARRSFGVRRSVLRSALVDGVPAFAHLVLVALAVYVASWSGWLLHAEDYERHLSATQYTRFVEERPCKDGATDNLVAEQGSWPTAGQPDARGAGEVVQSLRSLWSYHQDLYTFHTHFLDCSEHTYASKPSGWLLLNRPVGVAADTGIQPGTRGCDAPAGSDCLRQVLLIGTPVIWWGGIVALLFSAVAWVGTRDWRHGLVLVGTASTWLPWLLYDDRPIFIFYAIATLPFVVLSLTLALGRLIGPSRAPTLRRTVGVVVAGSFVVLAVVNFAWFWPIFTNGLLTHSEWLDRIWFERWI